MLGALSAEDIHIQYRILPDCQRTNISTAQTISQNRIKKKNLSKFLLQHECYPDSKPKQITTQRPSPSQEVI